MQKGSRFSSNFTYPIRNPMLAIIAIFVFIIIIIDLSTYFLATDYLCEHFSLFALIFLPTLFFILNYSMVKNAFQSMLLLIPTFCT